MSTLYTDNIRANNASQITVPTGQKIVGTDAGSIAAPGQVVQVVHSASPSSPSFSSTTLDTWLNTGTSVSITPKSTSNKVLIVINAAAYLTNSATFPRIYLAVGRGATVVRLRVQLCIWVLLCL